MTAAAGPDETADQQDLLEFLYACPVGLIEIDRAGEIVMVNAHAMKLLLPLAAVQAMGNLFDALAGCAPELRNMWESFAHSHGTVCEGHRIAVDLGEARAGSDPRVLALTLVKLRDDRGVLTLGDVSMQVAQEKRLKQAETWFASLIDEVNGYAALSIAPDGMIQSVNAAFTRQTGHDHQNVAGKPLNVVMVDDEDGPGSFRLSDQLHVAERDGWCLDERWQGRKDGSRYWCQRLFAARMDHDDERLVGFSVVLRDVARQGADTAELRRLLTRDHLTGAANRAYFRQILEREQSRWRTDHSPLALLLLDLDHFKSVNDVYGHPAGDLVLRQVVHLCTAQLRSGDLFARIGGEEFAALLPDTALQDAIAVAEKLRRAVAEMVVTSPVGPIGASVSLGCASLTEAGGSAEALIALADERLYRAKRAGRNRVCGPEALATA